MYLSFLLSFTLKRPRKFLENTRTDVGFIIIECLGCLGNLS